MRQRQAFTLMELLVVITVILLLVGMLLAAIRPIRESIRRSRTLAIMQVVQQSLGVLAAQRGGMVAAAEHPFAASMEPRRLFVRGDGAHASIPGSGAALLGAVPSDLTTGGEYLLLPDDRCADPTALAFFGIERRRLGILGVPLAGVTAYRQVKHATMPVDPSNDSNVRIINSTATVKDQAAFLQALFQGSAWTELTKLGCVRSPPDDLPANLLDSGRVWSSSGIDEESPVFSDGGVVRNYLLRGGGFYDAWGRELLYATTESGFSLESAGRDGCFVWTSGRDKVFQTESWATTPAGDDQNAATDNIAIGSGAK